MRRHRLNADSRLTVLLWLFDNGPATARTTAWTLGLRPHCAALFLRASPLTEEVGHWITGGRGRPAMLWRVVPSITDRDVLAALQCDLDADVWDSLGEPVGERPRHGHGNKKSATYRTWCSMKQRCGYSQNSNYRRYYQARGIKVCERWESFENFLADMGERPEGATLDRIDNDGDYEPSNCRWATPAEQAESLRRDQLLV